MESSSPAPDPVTPDPVSKSNKTVLLVVGSLLVVVVLALVVYFVTRTSPEEKALQAVCTARQDISKRVDSLAQTTLANFTLEGFKADLNGIKNDVQIIQENEAKLKPNRKQQIQQANQEFKSEVSSILSQLGRSLSLENAKDKLETAGTDLVASYQRTLALADCSGVKIDD